MTILFFDTETTGKKLKGVKPDDPRQPHIVQLAAVLTDDDLLELATINLLVFPFDWEISEEVTAFHGISHQMAEENGVGLTDALKTFNALASVTDRFVAHNIEFDSYIMNRAARHLAQLRGDTAPIDFFGTKQMRCSMKAATNVVKVLHKNPRHDADWKFPTLTECHEFFYGEGFEGAHDALADVRACIRVYRKLCEHYGMEP